MYNIYCTPRLQKNVDILINQSKFVGRLYKIGQVDRAFLPSHFSLPLLLLQNQT